MKRLIYLLPVAAFAVIAYFLFNSLFAPPPQILPSVLIDKPAPPMALGPLDGQTAGFTRADLARGHVSVVNFFASWCVPCRLEAGTLMNLSRLSGFDLYGVAYKDKHADARGFLNDAGDPFKAIVADDAGTTAIDWGVTAAPETFVVDGKGVIRFKFVGPLTDDVVKQQLLPDIQVASLAR